MSRAYAREADQAPNDLALNGVGSLMAELARDHPGLVWTPRIRFGGLIDIPDEKGETRVQGPAAGLAVDLRSPGSPERELLNLEKAVVRGRLPERPGEILLSDGFAARLGIGPGATATLIGATMYGSLVVRNFVVSGTIHFGVTAMDRGAIVADLTDVQAALDMEDAAGEILGFFRDSLYRKEAGGRRGGRLQPGAPRRHRRVRPRDGLPPRAERPGPDLRLRHSDLLAHAGRLHPGHVHRPLERRADVEPASLRGVRHPAGARRRSRPALPLAHRRGDAHRAHRIRCGNRSRAGRVVLPAGEGRQPRVDAQERLDRSSPTSCGPG